MKAMHSKKELKENLISLGIAGGDCVLIHSSFKSLGGIEGGAGGFFEVMLDVLGADGTLVMPTLSYDILDKPGEVRFDVRKTPSCVGWLTEYFRTELKDVRRSLHATHSCAATGKYADALIEKHLLDDTPVGTNSPFMKMTELGGKILILGSHPDHNTLMHGVEETVDFKPFIDFESRTDYHITDDNGRETVVPSFRHRFERENGWYEQKYSRILPLLDGNEIREGMILDAHSYLLRSEAILKKGHDKLLKDPYFFVEWMQTD